MNEDKKYKLGMIRTLDKTDAIYGKGIFAMDLTGFTKRGADAVVRDHIAGGSISDKDMDPNESQRAWITKYGYEIPPSKVRAQALICDIMEQLDWDVMCFQELQIGTEVVHVRDKKKVLVIRSITPGQKCKFEETGYTCAPRMLRKYRKDGDYSKTEIPKHFFWNGWLEK